jgi:hypothetical protein
MPERKAMRSCTTQGSRPAQQVHNSPREHSASLSRAMHSQCVLLMPPGVQQQALWLEVRAANDNVIRRLQLASPSPAASRLSS